MEIVSYSPSEGEPSLATHTDLATNVRISSSLWSLPLKTSS